MTIDGEQGDKHCDYVYGKILVLSCWIEKH